LSSFSTIVGLSDGITPPHFKFLFPSPSDVRRSSVKLTDGLQLQRIRDYLLEQRDCEIPF
ncbi:hypothetical protein PILCRDRAFT_810993, partial [Piloderma croceum F 1598]